MGSLASLMLSAVTALTRDSSDEITVSKYVWDVLNEENPTEIERLKAEHETAILSHGETLDTYTFRLRHSSGAAHARSSLFLVKRALRSTLQKTERELKKSQKDEARARHSVAISDRPSRVLTTMSHGGIVQTSCSSKIIFTDLKRSVSKEEAASSNSQDNICPVCLGEIEKKMTLEKCGHSFCEECIARAWEVKKTCPLCGRFYGKVFGNQPVDGRMVIRKDCGLHLPGYEEHGTIVIEYSFPAGIQGPEHPNPGTPYPGTLRIAFLPDSPEGNKVAGLLKKAFDQRLTFTIGTSMTTGQTNVITWNDIHHKTSGWGGPRFFGYPDPTYLARVREELWAKGITED
ncbi:probable E3 ubiquitin-protein ligase DTX3 [Protopterus annectens]|uniref:probable E3 ubiquitin-protein ligase DTX3 n=1 Tax=Protopterus annectens TaxID=7888 RepID=UPI001CFA40A2|nr:probable E3 ubiquitin-protein ligase DTX3 [Protopterus annectens]